MPSIKVLLLGATGETGKSILDGLLADGSYDVTLFMRPSSSSKPAVNALRARGLSLLFADITAPTSTLSPLLQPFSIVISAIGGRYILDQLNLVDAAAAAKVQRFVPCGFITIAPRGDIMLLRDEKEIVHDRIFSHKMPYTIIDIGHWYQISYPRLASGKVDYACVNPVNEVAADGTARNCLVDKRDIGRFVARILRDERTVNKRVLAYGEVLTQREIIEIMEKKSGEKIETTEAAADELLQRVKTAKSALDKDSTLKIRDNSIYTSQYDYSKYVREDNTPEVAKYLGYIDAHKLYPDLVPGTFEDFVSELLEGKIEKPYAQGFT